MISKAGNYKAKAYEVMLGTSKKKGTPFVGVKFRVTDGEFAGETLKWEGYLSDKAGASGKTTAERTIESLQYCGWRGDDLSEFTKGLHGLDTSEVELVVEMEEGLEDPSKKFPKVQWVNRVGGGVSFAGEAMNTAQAAEFGRKYRGLALTLRAKAGQAPAPKKDEVAQDEIPF